MPNFRRKKVMGQINVPIKGAKKNSLVDAKNTEIKTKKNDIIEKPLDSNVDSEKFHNCESQIKQGEIGDHNNKINISENNSNAITPKLDKHNKVLHENDIHLTTKSLDKCFDKEDHSREIDPLLDKEEKGQKHNETNEKMKKNETKKSPLKHLSPSKKLKKSTPPEVILNPSAKIQLEKTKNKDSSKDNDTTSNNDSIFPKPLNEVSNKTSMKAIRTKQNKTRELSQGKKIFAERKKQYKEKLVSGELEPKKMTMFDLIYFNPETNPLPKSDLDLPPKKKARHSDAASSRSSICSASLAEEQRIDDIDLNESCNSPSRPPSAMSMISNCSNRSLNNQNTGINDKMEMEENKENGGQNENGQSFVEEEEEEPIDPLAPQVKIGPDGNIIIDEKSLTVKTTAAKQKEIFHKTDVVIETADSANQGRWSKRNSRSLDWSPKETAM